MTKARTRPSRASRKPPIEREVHLQDWGARGAANTTVDDRTVAIDRAIPGETVVATIDRRRRPWRGVADQIIVSSTDRVAPSCEHFLQGCGGCQWQHVSYEAQLHWKRELVDREMVTAGASVRVSAVHGMENPWRYRRTAAVAIGWEAGFRPRGRKGIVEVHDCPISHPLIGRMSHQLNQLLRAGALPNYHGKMWIEVTVVGTEAQPSLQLVLQGTGGLAMDTHSEIPDVARHLSRLDGVQTVAFRHRSGEVFALLGDLVSEIEVAERLMYLPAGSFFQTNLKLLPALIARLEKLVENRRPRNAADIYGGVGTFGLPLARYVETMTLVELDALAVEAARRTAMSWKLPNMRFVSKHAERALPEIDDLDLAVVDPPRSGLGEVVVEALLKTSPSLLLYVSCAPASLARDLAAFERAGYTTETLELFDFYPQTYHVESLAVLSR